MAELELTERRARFVYEAARLAAREAKAPIVPAPWDEREEAFRKQFLEVIDRQCGPQRSTSPEELHGSWMQAYFAMGWRYGETYDRDAKTHPDLVPYAQLGQLERDKDSVFVALCEIARQWIYDGSKGANAMTEAAPTAPIPMLLWCPECGKRHVDKGEFATRVHHTHACQHCGHCWRPAVVPTVGVQYLPGFKDEPPPGPFGRKFYDRLVSE